ncbi:ATP-binding protein [Streptomyces sp. CS057]|uniref:ATP-binding protein n=1 Tax=Streptomyces sp. CS057 TaxID=1982764 RepID=UPI000B420F53|nr:AAA family ATPase [Streptomyces sp. CS057]OWA24762.1 ATP-binding protein [Streptomyces sp. CS057]
MSEREAAEGPPIPPAPPAGPGPGAGSAGADSAAPGPVRLDAFAPGGRVYQAARDLYVSEGHHVRPAGPLAVVEPVLPTDEAAAEVFVGRGTERREVLAVLDPAHGATGMIVASSVAGLAGIGKTALARSCAAEAVGRGWYAGGAVFVDLNGYARDPADQVMPEHVFAPMLHALGFRGRPADSPAGQAAQYHRMLADLAAEGRPVLLVLDNASSTAQISDLMPRSRAHRTLITSRHTLVTRGSRTLELGALSPAGARALVEEQLEFLSPGGTRTRQDATGTERLCRLCGHLPLALHIATALLARDPDLTPSELADELARARHKLDVLDDGERAVRAAFELSYRRLTPQQARMFRLLPVNPGPHIATDAVARLVDLPDDRAVGLIRELARAHVVERVGNGVWRQHDLMRAYAIELLGRHGDNQGAASNRLIEHYISLAADAMSALHGEGPAPSFATVEAALAWCDREHPNLQAATSMAATFGDDDGALRIQETLVAVYAHRGQTAEWEAAARMAVRFAREAKDHPGRSRALHQVMVALERGGRQDEAMEAAGVLLRFQQVVIEAASLAEHPLDCQRLLQHAVAAVAESGRLLGEREDRLLHTRRTDIARVANARHLDETFREIGPRAPRRPAGPDTEDVPGEDCRGTGPRAPRHPAGPDTEDIPGEDFWGSVPRPPRRPPEPAAEEEVPDVALEATRWAREALERLSEHSPGGAHSVAGAAPAQMAARRALSLIPEDLRPEDADDWRGVCALLARFAAARLAGGPMSRDAGRLAQRDWSWGVLPHVASTYEIVVQAYRRVNDAAAQVRLYTDLAEESFQSGAYPLAAKYRLAAAGIAEAMGDEEGQGEALSAAAHAHLLLANHEEAARFAERAFPLLTAAKRPGPAGRALTTLANARYSLNLPARALSAALGAEALTASAGDLPGRTAALLVLGLAQRATDRAKDSSASWRTALHIARTLDDPYLTPSTESFLKSVGHLRG